MREGTEELGWWAGLGWGGWGGCHPGKGQEQRQKRVCHVTGETSHQGETPHVAAAEINKRKKKP